MLGVKGQKLKVSPPTCPPDGTGVVRVPGGSGCNLCTYIMLRVKPKAIFIESKPDMLKSYTIRRNRCDSGIAIR